METLAKYQHSHKHREKTKSKNKHHNKNKHQSSKSVHQNIGIKLNLKFTDIIIYKIRNKVAMSFQKEISLSILLEI